ncbi:hypothetical protein HID58_071895, partial [Brassica napus]
IPNTTLSLPTLFEENPRKAVCSWPASEAFCLPQPHFPFASSMISVIPDDMWDVSGAQRRSPVVLCPRRSEAGQANGESGADASRVKWRSRDGPALRVLIAELDEHFPLVSSVLIAEVVARGSAEGRVVVRGAVPTWGWFNAVARPGEREVRYFTLIKQCFVIGLKAASKRSLSSGSRRWNVASLKLFHVVYGRCHRLVATHSKYRLSGSVATSSTCRVSAQCGWSHCLNQTFTVSKPLIITSVVFLHESMRLMGNVATGNSHSCTRMRGAPMDFHYRSRIGCGHTVCSGSRDELVLAVVKNTIMYFRLRWIRVKDHLVSVPRCC